jgi:murein L,D-transpeptidase YcbB/YkuD
VGAETLEAMNVPAQERLLQVLLNLDRWRWLPRELGERYVLVNVAGFELAVMENHAPVLRMNVVVGKDGWRTPFFQDSLEFIVVNPYWNVPPSIVRRDLVPAVERDPGYLARNGYEVLNRSGRRVDPYAVNVSSDAYTIRQRPGSNNALGEVKFVFPNAMNIYLHDTPAKHLFERSRRAFSSGCIRVEKPRELAEYLLRTATTTPPGTYERLRETGREQWVELDEKLPIYILYFTAWADEQGSVRFYQDVYRRDSAMSHLARAKLGPPSPGVVTGELAENQQSSRR